MKKLIIVSTHPIQYYAPLFKLLASNTDLLVLYSWGINSIHKYDPGFKREIQWDIPLLDGYKYKFLENTSKNPGSHHFRGIINPDIIDTINAFSPHAILVFGWSYWSHLNVMRHFKGKIPVWFRGDSTLLDNNLGTKEFLKLYFLRWVYSHVDKVFYVGQNNKEYFLRYGVKTKDMVFAPHAIDNNRFSAPYEIDAKTLRNDLKVSDSDILVLYAGKFEKKKNPVSLVKTFLEINHPGAHLLLVGNGPLEGELLQLSTSSNIHLMAFQNQKQMPVIYQAADIFCLPSCGPGETWGLAVNEAMAASKAVLVSNKVGCAKDLVKTDYNGAIFESGNDEDFKRSIVSLFDKKLLSRFGANSKAIIDHWTIEKTSKIIIEELQRLHN